MNTLRRSLVAAATAIPFAPFVRAAAFPSREVRLLVPTSAGSTTDTLARELAAVLQRTWGEIVLVENVPGASSQLATQRLLRSPADGHCVQVTNTALFTNAAWSSTLPYDTFADLRGVCRLVSLPSYVVGPARFATLDELLAASRQAPGRFSYGSSGVRSGPHIGMALLADQAGVRWLHVPYKGLQEAAVDLSAGRLDMALLPRGMALSAVAAGRGRILAATEPVPWPEGQGLPALSRRYGAYRYRGIFGAIVPSATPAPVVAALQPALARAVAELAASRKLEQLGLMADPSTAAEFQAAIREEVQLWREWGERLVLD